MCTLQFHCVHYPLHGLLTSRPCFFMKQSVCFQLRNRILLKFKGSYVTAETAVQQPPKQEAVHRAAFPALSWLCASVCPSAEEKHEEARPDETLLHSVPVDGFKLHHMSLSESCCVVDVACLCCPVVSSDRPDMGSCKVGRTGTLDHSMDFRTLFQHKRVTLRLLHL